VSPPRADGGNGAVLSYPEDDLKRAQHTTKTARVRGHAPVGRSITALCWTSPSAPRFGAVLSSPITLEARGSSPALRSTIARRAQATYHGIGGYLLVACIHTLQPESTTLREDVIVTVREL
jgi:hypothetical protein